MIRTSVSHSWISISENRFRTSRPREFVVFGADSFDSDIRLSFVGVFFGVSNPPRRQQDSCVVVQRLVINSDTTARTHPLQFFLPL